MLLSDLELVSMLAFETTPLHPLNIFLTLTNIQSNCKVQTESLARRLTAI